MAQPSAALPDTIGAAERSFAAAARESQASGMVQAILDLEAATAAWAADTDDDQEPSQWAPRAPGHQRSGKVART